MRFVVATVGRPRDPAIGRAVADYEARAGRYWPLETIEVREGGGGSASEDLVRIRQTQQVLQRVAGMRVILCERDGARRTSEDFARWMLAMREAAHDVAFVIGGALGVAEPLAAAAWATLSLAPWTLPHELARLVLVEQLYRAGTIIRGEPYHK